MTTRIIKSKPQNQKTLAINSGSGATHFAIPNNCSPIEIECKRDGHVIQSIIVRCPCGNEVELLCDYADQEAA